MTGGGGGVRGVTEGLEDDAVFIGERCIEPLVSQGGVRPLQLSTTSSALMCQMFRCSQDTKPGYSCLRKGASYWCVVCALMLYNADVWVV